MKLVDKVVVITGASDGIGKEIALRLSGEGCSLALIGRNEQRLENVRKECVDLGAKKVQSYSCDISSLSAVSETVQSIITDFTVIDVLLNNAGIWQKLGQLDEMKDSVVDDVIDTNLKGLIYMTKHVLPVLRKQKEAIILNISSKSGITAQEGQTVYTASKYGVRGFTEVLVKDLKDTNIHVAGLYQSGTNTAMFEKSGQDFPVEDFSEPSDLAEIVATMLLLPPKIWLQDVRVEKC